MVRWHHRLNGHEFEQTPGDGEGQSMGVLQSLGCCSPWGCKVSEMTQQLNSNNLDIIFIHPAIFHVLYHRVQQDAFIAAIHPRRSDRFHLAAIQGWQSVTLIPSHRGATLSSLPQVSHPHPLLVDIHRERCRNK